MARLAQRILKFRVVCWCDPGKSFVATRIPFRVTSGALCDRWRPVDFRYAPLDGVIGRPSLWIAEDLGAALQADGETRQARRVAKFLEARGHATSLRA